MLSRYFLFLNNIKKSKNTDNIKIIINTPKFNKEDQDYEYLSKTDFDKIL